MSRYTIIRPDGTIDNIVEWDGETEWSPPEGHTVRLALDTDTLPGPDPVAL